MSEFGDQSGMTVDFEVDHRSPNNQLDLNHAILHTLAHNQIWLNGYACMRPSEEFLRDLGATVLMLLNNPANTLPLIDLRAMQADPMSDLSQAQRDNVALYLRVIKS